MCASAHEQAADKADGVPGERLHREAIASSEDSDLSPIAAGLQGIADQIEQYPPQALRRAAHDQIRRDIAVDMHTALLGLGEEQFED